MAAENEGADTEVSNRVGPFAAFGGKCAAFPLAKERARKCSAFQIQSSTS